MDIDSDLQIDIQEILAFAIELSLETGELLRDGFQSSKEIDYKSSAIDPVTQFDKAAEALIVERVISHYPSHSIVAEEGNNRDGNGRLQWYIDPIDGTVNFAHGLPHFSISLAVYDGDTPLVGVVYDPMRDECFCASAGGGAFVRHAGSDSPMHVSKAETLLHSVLATGYPYDKHTSDVDNVKETAVFLKKSQGIRRAGSAALDIAYVAAGRIDGYWEYKLNSWDYGAAVLLVLEAGGQVTMIDGSPLVPLPKAHLLVSNGRLHPVMQETLDAI